VLPWRLNSRSKIPAFGRVSFFVAGTNHLRLEHIQSAGRLKKENRHGPMLHFPIFSSPMFKAKAEGTQYKTIPGRLFSHKKGFGAN